MTSKKIAVITGASSGIGRQFADTVSEFGTFDEVWVIARRIERLQELCLPFKTRVISLDLADRESYSLYANMLETEKPDVALLINASGFGKFCATDETAVDVNLNMVDLNCQAIIAMCQYTLPYMNKGAHIVNIASVAAFQPVPYINVYSASKAFVLHYSRSLNRELKKREISVTAVCPFWTKTEFFERAIAKDDNAVVKKYVALYKPQQIVSRAWRDVKRRHDVSQFGFIARTQTLLAKILPHSFVMSFWMNQQKLD